MPTTRSGKPLIYPLSSSPSSSPNPDDCSKGIKRSRTELQSTSIFMDENSNSHVTLPNEIIHHIISYMASQKDRSTLASFCRVSKTLYKMASPLLWNHLVLSPWKLANEDGNLVLDETKETCGHMKTKQKNGKALRNDVKTLSVYHHPSHWCNPNSRSTLQLPNLQTAHIYLNDGHTLHEGERPWKDCRLLGSSTPQVVIIHNARPGSAYSFPKGMFAEARTIVFTTFVHQIEETLTELLFPLPESAMSRLKRVYLVFDPTTPQEVKAKSSTYPPSDHMTHLVDLVSHFITKKVTFVFVNAIETVGRVIRPHLSSKPFKSSMKSKLGRELSHLKPSIGDRTKYIEEYVKFYSLETFKKINQNDKYFDEDQVDGWLNMMAEDRSTKKVVEVQD